MHILDKIVFTKKEELEKKTISANDLEIIISKLPNIRSLKNKLEREPGIITEFKRKSPSKGWFNQDADVVEITKNYELAGAAAVSVLTDQTYFGGSLEDLKKARNAINIPILRKEFIIDPYQILEARAFGADLILLIARILTKEKIIELSKFAKELGLEVLIEIHNKNELDLIDFTYIDFVGVNNRDLDTFKIDVQISFDIYNNLPENVIKISESGIFDVNVVKDLIKTGYRGFLIGENFMSNSDFNKCRNFINSIKN